MHADEHGRLWMSTGTRLWRFDEDGRLTGPLPAGGLGAIHLIASDRRGGLWLYDVQRGLQRLVDGQLVSAPLPDEVRHAHLAWMDTRRDGTLWLATADERLVSVSTDGEAAVYDRDDGLDAGIVRAMLVDDEGTLWLGGHEGLVRFQDGRFSTIRDIHGHAMESMTGVIVDGGQVWAGLRSGILRVPREDLHRRMALRATPLSPGAHQQGRRSRRQPALVRTSRRRSRPTAAGCGWSRAVACRWSTPPTSPPPSRSRRAWTRSSSTATRCLKAISELPAGNAKARHPVRRAGADLAVGHPVPLSARRVRHRMGRGRAAPARVVHEPRARASTGSTSWPPTPTAPGRRSRRCGRSRCSRCSTRPARSWRLDRARHPRHRGAGVAAPPQAGPQRDVDSPRRARPARP